MYLFNIFSTLDKMAYITIGKVLAQRCLESGIFDMINTYEALPGSKVSFYIFICHINLIFN
jgi:hypothetical protein